MHLILKILAPARYNAGTPMEHSMEDKVLKPLLHKKLKDKSLRKPLLVHCSGFRV